MKKLLLPLLLLVALPAFGQTVAIDRNGFVQNLVVKFDGTTHTLWVDGVEITGAAMTDARTPLAHAASHASAGSDPLTLAMSQITGLVAALAGKSDTGHTHAFADITAKPTTIAGYGITDLYTLGDARWALLAHTHSQSDVTNLVSDLAGKVPITRTVNGQALSGNVTLDTDDIADTTDKRYVTDAQRTVIENTSGVNSGDQTITLTGDVTGTGTGSFATTIANNAVSLAKLADMATASFLGRNTAATGDPEVLSIATVKTMLNLTGTNSGDQIVPVNTTATASQWLSAYNSATGEFTKAQPAFSDLSGSIVDGQIPAAFTRDTEWDTAAEINDATTDADFSLATHSHPFDDITAKPTTIGGYGITDFNSLGDARWSLLAHAHTGSTISGIDISDDTNLAGTANEITLTGDTLSLHAAITRDAEWDTIGEIETATGTNIITSAETLTLSQLPVVPQCHVYHDASQSLTNDTVTALAFNSEREDTDSMHDTVTNNGRIVFNTAGRYEIKILLSFATNATGIRQCHIKLNGTTYIASITTNAAASGNARLVLSCSRRFAATNYIEIEAHQNSGGALNVLSTAEFSPELTAVMVSR